MSEPRDEGRHGGGQHAEGRHDGRLGDAGYADGRLAGRSSEAAAPGRRALSPLARRVVVAAMAGAVGALAAAWLRGYQLDLALVTGVAVGLLAFATLRTIDRMRGLLRR